MDLPLVKSWSSSSQMIINRQSVLVLEDYVSLPPEYVSPTPSVRDASSGASIPSPTEVKGVMANMLSSSRPVLGLATDAARALYTGISLSTNPTPLGVLSWLYGNADDY